MPLGVTCLNKGFDLKHVDSRPDSSLTAFANTINAFLALAFHAGVFRGARLSSLTTNACSTEDNIPVPSLANHIVLSKFWKVDLNRRVI